LPHQSRKAAISELTASTSSAFASQTLASTP
jgi:hypothetical protein